jgi:hypothetical protein
MARKSRLSRNQHRDRAVAATPSQTAGVEPGSRPQPPKAVAQRASLEAGSTPGDDQGKPRRLTGNTVAEFASIWIGILRQEWFWFSGLGVIQF